MIKFSILITLDGKKTLEELAKKKHLLLIYFSEHGTPLCTKQLLSFKEEIDMLKTFNMSIYAVSTDSIEEISSFSNNLNGLPFKLGSDPEGNIAKQLGIYDNEQKKANRSIVILNKECEIIYSNLFYQPDNIDDFVSVFDYLTENIK